MDAAIASGAIDMVGLARPMTFTPDLPARLLDGTLAVAPSCAVRCATASAKLDDALQVMWFQAQIHELAEGREPDLALGAWTAPWRGVRAQLWPKHRTALELAAAPHTVAA